jgi:hypothetical protein
LIKILYQNGEHSIELEGGGKSRRGIENAKSDSFEQRQEPRANGDRWIATSKTDRIGDGIFPHK